MNHPRDCGKVRACLIGVATHRKHIIKLPLTQVICRLTVMAGYINAYLMHDLHRVRIKTMSLDASRKRFDHIAAQVPT